MRDGRKVELAGGVCLVMIMGPLASCSPTLNSDEFPNQGDPDVERICDPGLTQGCSCPPEDRGTQTCREDGAGWGTCDCGRGISDDSGHQGEGEGERPPDGGSEPEPHDAGAVPPGTMLATNPFDRGTGSGKFGVVETPRAGQSFVSVGTAPVATVGVQMRREGSPSEGVRCLLFVGDAMSDDLRPMAVSSVIDLAGVSTENQAVEFHFPASPLLIKGKSYIFVLERTGALTTAASRTYPRVVDGPESYEHGERWLQSPSGELPPWRSAQDVPGADGTPDLVFEVVAGAGSPCEAILAGRGDPEADSDEDGVPDGVECELGLDPLDGAEPGEGGWYEDFEREGGLADVDGWEVAQGETRCIQMASPGRGERGSAVSFRASGGGCSANQMARRVRVGGPSGPGVLASWFHDQGDPNAEIRMSLVDEAATNGLTVGLHPTHFGDRYVLFSSFGGERRRTEPAAPRESGWHLAVLDRRPDGRTYGFIDGIALGSFPSPLDAHHAVFHVAVTQARWDDVVAHASSYGPTNCFGTPMPEGWSCIPPTGPQGFVMGSPEEEPGRITPRGQEDEQEHQHRVVLTRPTVAKSKEVTQNEWEALMGDKEFNNDECGGSCPADSVSWLEAIDYCNALSRLHGLDECYRRDGAVVSWPMDLDCPGYRLPTEAEWEHMARAGAATPFPDGDDQAAADRAGWCSRQPPDTQPVGTKPANPWGLHDVHGNVWEKVWDWAGPYETRELGPDVPPVIDPTGPGDGPARGHRGGHVGALALDCRSARRHWVDSSYQGPHEGLRPVRTVVPR